MASARRAAMAEADQARADAYAEANARFVAGLRPLLDGGSITMTRAAEVADVHRARIYQIMREHPQQFGTIEQVER